MLEARKIPSFPDKLHSEVEGDIENVNGTMVISKIRVKYFIKIPKGKREATERSLSLHQDKCPAASSVKDSIAISWTAEIEEIE
ncbi:MAG: OsmC family protein [bacterium]